MESKTQATSPEFLRLESLRGEKVFRQVRRYGVNVRRELFSLRVTDYRPRYGQPWKPAAQVGIVVPKKVLKSAVKRNRVRRRVREALRTLPPTLLPTGLPACRAILFPTAEVLGAPFDELQAQLAAAFAEAPRKIERAGVQRGGGKRKHGPRHKRSGGKGLS